MNPATTPRNDQFRAAPTPRGQVLAFLRFLAFAALSVALILGVILLSVLIDPEVADQWSIEIQETAQVVGVLAATTVMARMSRRPLSDFGLGGSDRSRNFWVGVAAGTALMSLLLLMLRAAAAFSFGGMTALSATILLHAFSYAILMLAVAVSEEMLCRGYALVALSESISFWPAALVLGVVFGLMHGFNGGETVLGMASAAVSGIILAYSFRWTRSLLFAFGYHAGWDYAESFVFGVPNSGEVLSPSLFHPTFDGPAWLTGGSAGPEASVLMLPVLGALLLVIRKFLRPAAGGAAPAR